MKTVQLSIIGLTYSQSQNNAYALLLGEENGPRRLPIVIGAFEAQSIAIALEKDLMPPRPLTHDLFTSLGLSFNIYLKEVIIHKLDKGIFYSYLVCELDGVIKKIDSRTSDAVALALRFNSPIYTFESILEQAGIILDDETKIHTPSINYKAESIEPKQQETSDKARQTASLIRLSDQKLQEKLNDAIELEDYEQAALIRDEISKRNPQS